MRIFIESQLRHCKKFPWKNSSKRTNVIEYGETTWAAFMPRLLKYDRILKIVSA